MQDQKTAPGSAAVDEEDQTHRMPDGDVKAIEDELDDDIDPANILDEEGEDEDDE